VELETRRIKILGDEGIQLEVKIPKSSNEFPSEPIEVSALAEMGWKVVEERTTYDTYDTATVEYNSYPLKHTVSVKCEQSQKCPLATSHGFPQESIVKGRVVIPATVIESENELMRCRVTDDQIQCHYPLEESHKEFLEPLEDSYNEVTVYDNPEFDGTIHFNQNLELEDNRIKNYRIEIDYFPPETEEFKLDPTVNWKEKKESIFKALEQPRKIISNLIWTDNKECTPPRLFEETNANSLRKASMLYWEAVNLAVDGLLAHQTNTKNVFSNRVEKLSELINEMESDTPLWYNLGKYKEIYEQDKEILYEQCFLNGVCDPKEIDTQVRKTGELMVYTEWFVNRGEKN